MNRNQPRPPSSRDQRLDRLIDRHGTGSDAVAVAGPGVGASMSSGARWMGSARIASQIIRIVATLVLTQFLSPDDFGIVALVGVVTGMFDRVLGDTGTTTALVRHPELRHRLACSVWYLNITVGGATSVLLVVCAGPVSSLLGDSRADDLLRVLGLLALVGAFSYVPRALLRRERAFAKMAAIDLSNAVVGSLVMVFAAVQGAGEWSLVFGNLAGGLVAAALALVLTNWCPSLHFSRADISQISRFSAFLTAQNLFGYLIASGDRFIVGRFIGTAELGYYGMANRLLRYPVQTATQTYRDVVFPNLARIQDDFDAMAQAYKRSMTAIAFVMFPVSAAVVAVSTPLVAVMLGPDWLPVADLLAIIAVVSALQAVAVTTGSLYNARGRSDLAFYWQLASSAVLMACYIAGSSWGVVGVAWGFLAGVSILTIPALAVPLRLIDASVVRVARDAATIGLVSVLSGAGGYALRRLVASQGAGNLVQVIVGVAVAVAIYGAYALGARPQALDDLLGLVRRGPSKPAAT